MIKRKIVFGTYDTAAQGWTLTGWTLAPAEEKTNFVEKQGGDGSFDLSTALTDGIATFRDRNLTVTLESSEGDRLTREAEIRNMVNTLHGTRVDIDLPDDPYRHLSGRLRVQKEYNDLAHAAVTVTAVCDPWKYDNDDTVVTLTATTAVQTSRIVNTGRRAVVPTLKVEGTNANITISYKTQSTALSAGTHQWPLLLLTPGTHDLKYTGTGKLTVTYREAVLE